MPAKRQGTTSSDKVARLSESKVQAGKHPFEGRPKPYPEDKGIHRLTGAQVRHFRECLGLSQRGLAQILGMNAASLWKVENSVTPASSQVTLILYYMGTHGVLSLADIARTDDWLRDHVPNQGVIDVGT